MSNNPQSKKRIVVLGGGPSALSAVFALTNVSNWQDHYTITVYQIGWRLGGKCASGRNARKNYRVEEHGLHVWGGFYENAFWMIKKVYKELARAEDAPMSTWDKAFIGQDTFFLKEGAWDFWSFCLPKCQHTEPGFDETNSPNGLREVVFSMLDAFQDWFEEFLQPDQAAPPPTVEPLPSLPQLAALVEGLMLRGDHLTHSVLHTLGRVFRRLLDEGTDVSFDLLGELLKLVRMLVKHHFRHDPHKSDAVNRDNQHRWIIYDYLLTNFIGILKDDLLTRSLDEAISDLEYGKWLFKHGMSQETWASPLIHAMYDLVFAFPDGEFGLDKRDADAASMLKVTLQILRYRGSSIYRMAAGMGDTVIAPLYQVLKKRGVQFEFFHAVTNLGLSPDRDRIETIQMRQQVTLKQPYEPLIDVDGLPCWPSEPLYEQIVDGAILEELTVQGAVHLEAPDSTWAYDHPITLQAGQDYDELILGISIGGLPAICDELIHADAKWRRMIHEVKTIPTQSLQLWLRPRLQELGWMQAPKDLSPLTGGGWMMRMMGCDTEGDKSPAEKFTEQSPMVGGVFNTPDETMDTWVAMDHLIKTERYPEGEVGTIAYFTGLLKFDGENPGADAASRAAALEVVKQNTEHLLKHIASRLFGFSTPLSLSTDPGAVESPIIDVYLRSNTVPSDRYVLSVAGSKKHRLSCQEPHFGNMWIVGDWTRCGLDLGYVEAAITSGLLGARALLKASNVPGYAPRIVGGDDYYWLGNENR